ncbi:MAG: tRNA (adenosine(37)-N6)-threonylcarbamoyltransferase complex ATPase subunit type 1 TsaE [Afipia sp.]|nr:tRNA (adenosine(37)-N6)-threonylcarbamoyltransferase complex ATPase subunit type 1 TsaE [Afipia sp.]
MTEPSAFSIALANEAATAQLMADLGLLIGPGDVIALAGDLGAGKTAAARALIRFLAGDEGLEVPSPTFTLAQSYDLPPFPLLHTDLYRVDDPNELEELGLVPFPDGTVVLIEWPERAPSSMPADRIEIALSHRPSLGLSARAAEIRGYGQSAAKVDRLIAMRRFLTLSGFADARRERMAGDASSRSYSRLYKDDQPVVLMNSPRRPDGPPAYDGKSYSAAVHLAEDVRPFMAIANGLRERGYSAPAIHHADIDDGFLIIEDFGRGSFVAGDPPSIVLDRYQAAVEMLAALHQEQLPDVLPVAPHIKHRVPLFDNAAMMTEVGLVMEWYLPDKGVKITSNLHAEFLLAWNELFTKLAAAPRTWVLRDFHSPNLIWLDRRLDTARVGVIDFQDAVIGPTAYDLVSLLQDARIDVPETVEIAMLTHYAKLQRESDPSFNAAAFVEYYAIMSAQRNTRLLGTFARLNRRDNKPQYLRHQPRAWAYLKRALAHPSLISLREWCGAYVPPPA